VEHSPQSWNIATVYAYVHSNSYCGLIPSSGHTGPVAMCDQLKQDALAEARDIAMNRGCPELAHSFSNTLCNNDPIQAMTVAATMPGQSSSCRYKVTCKAYCCDQGPPIEAFVIADDFSVACRGAKDVVKHQAEVQGRTIRCWCRCRTERLPAPVAPCCP
jgi:hypothetical protein